LNIEQIFHKKIHLNQNKKYRGFIEGDLEILRPGVRDIEI
jgi:hypothetical protein